MIASGVFFLLFGGYDFSVCEKISVAGYILVKNGGRVGTKGIGGIFGSTQNLRSFIIIQSTFNLTNRDDPAKKGLSFQPLFWPEIRRQRCRHV